LGMPGGSRRPAFTGLAGFRGQLRFAGHGGRAIGSLRTARHVTPHEAAGQLANESGAATATSQAVAGQPAGQVGEADVTP